jgi:release factor glutamine methyltransferase
LKRVVDGEPVAYILGEKEFYGLDFFVDNRVLLPRPETEMIVEKVLEYFGSDVVDSDLGFRLLDVGTGSGNIVVSIAKSASDFFVDADAVDISDDALEVARLNAQQHCVEDRISFFNSDLLENIEDAEKYDVIVANLPYIGELENNFVEENVERYEPSLALFAGDDGLELYKKMFQQIIDKEISFDLMIGEFGFGQAEGVLSLMNKYFDHRSCSIEKDLAGIDRIFVIK